jgi:hypothetical protein
MNVGRFGRVGRWAGRLVVALALAGVLLAAGSIPTSAPTAPAALAAPAAALVCEIKPTRVGWRCFCRGAYGWRAAPAVMCRVSR